MKRVVEPEWLDELPASDSCAVQSRRDLRRLNRLLRHAAVFEEVLTRCCAEPRQSIGELGAGDGTLMLDLAARLHRSWPAMQVTLVDRLPVASAETLKRLDDYGWRTRTVIEDAFNWVQSAEPVDVLLVNLFLHHLEDSGLQALFRAVSGKANLFVACETRRSSTALAASHCVGLLGCNRVTRHDAVLSTRAGFTGNELSELWPEPLGWRLNERRVGTCTHLFVARRLQPSPAPG
jgi:hypothetical protein